MNSVQSGKLTGVERIQQFGGGLLSVVATSGIVMVLVQGSLFYKAKSSAGFLSTEKNKVLAGQIAEAAVQANIADIAKRRVVVTPNMADYTTYHDQEMGAGMFSSHLTTVGMGAAADTVDLVATGTARTATQEVDARLKLINHYDTNRVITLNSIPVTTTTYTNVIVKDTVSDTTVMDPNTMPYLNVQPAYLAFMASGAKKGDVCHFPGGNPSNAHVINISKNAVGTHISHHGDYLTTDATCDMYKPKITKTITSRTVSTPVVTTTYIITPDTVSVIDTVVRVKVISWR